MRFTSTIITEASLEWIFKCYKRICNDRKQCLVFAHVRVVLNQWCTARRFGLPSRSCHFCENGLDELEHYLACASFHRLFSLALNQSALVLSLENILFLTHDSAPLPSPVVRYVMLFCYVGFCCVNGCRHGQTFEKEQINFYLKRIATRCSKIRGDIVFYRQTSLRLSMTTL